MTKKHPKSNGPIDSITIRNDPADPAPLGITINANKTVGGKGPLYVTAVDLEGPLGGELYIGDKIIEINGEDVRKLDKHKKKTHLEKCRRATEINFKVERGPNHLMISSADDSPVKPYVSIPANDRKDSINVNRVSLTDSDGNQGSSSHSEPPNIPDTGPRHFDNVEYAGNQEMFGNDARSLPQSDHHYVPIVAHNNIQDNHQHSRIEPQHNVKNIQQNYRSEQNVNMRYSSNDRSIIQANINQADNNQDIEQNQQDLQETRVDNENELLRQEIIEIKQKLDRQNEIFHKMVYKFEEIGNYNRRQLPSTIGRVRNSSAQLWLSPVGNDKRRSMLPQKYVSDSDDEFAPEIRELENEKSVKPRKDDDITEITHLQNISKFQEKASKNRPSKVRNRSMQNNQQVAIPIEKGQVRRVIIQKHSERLGITILGGNSRGIFIGEVTDETTKSFIKPGDKILAGYGVPFYNLTIEDATLKLMSIPVNSKFELYVQFSPDEYEYVKRHRIADDFWIRVNIDMNGLEVRVEKRMRDGEISKQNKKTDIRKGTILHVLNTQYFDRQRPHTQQQEDTWYCLMVDNKTSVEVPSRRNMQAGDYDSVVLSKADSEVKRPVVQDL